MLPDFPKVKEKILEALSKRIQTRSMPWLFQRAKHLRYHEGHRYRIVRADGSVVEDEFKEASSKISLDLSQWDSITTKDIIARIDTAAEEIESQVARHFYGEISKSAEGVGNVIDAGGRPFTAEMYLEVLEKVQLDFYEDGTPHELALVCSPNMAPRIKAELQRLHDEPELARRYNELIEKKRTEWRERENSRKLVG
ncbi:hypothetical protein Adeg_1343 [Ammonifex degensii KC4]|uniref:Uncharacterized protein n=1 Tax=Ammonifex degensii (strain DSM 10501 / KC4) TaxID=429009 RepID=C9R821_AMMDK|nr:hypothetical protein [Ammonifex degensii]ACX52450.1 hypothetical protein Adeg_1343 [Ammonifex degensii KC4]